MFYNILHEVPSEKLLFVQEISGILVKFLIEKRTRDTSKISKSLVFCTFFFLKLKLPTSDTCLLHSFYKVCCQIFVLYMTINAYDMQ